MRANAASKAALDNMTRSFARKLAPEVKVNSIAPSLILFNEHDDAEYRQQALNKSLMKTAPGEKEVIDLVDYYKTLCRPWRFTVKRCIGLFQSRP